MVSGLNANYSNTQFMGMLQNIISPNGSANNNNGSIFEIGFIPTIGIGPNPALDQTYKDIDKFLFDMKSGMYPPTKNPYTGEALNQTTQQTQYANPMQDPNSMMMMYNNLLVMYTSLQQQLAAQQNQ